MFTTLHNLLCVIGVVLTIVAPAFLNDHISFTGKSFIFLCPICNVIEVIRAEKWKSTTNVIWSDANSWLILNAAAVWLVMHSLFTEQTADLMNRTEQNYMNLWCIIPTSFQSPLPVYSTLKMKFAVLNIHGLQQMIYFVFCEIIAIVRQNIFLHTINSQSWSYSSSFRDEPLNFFSCLSSSQTKISTLQSSNLIIILAENTIALITLFVFSDWWPFLLLKGKFRTFSLTTDKSHRIAKLLSFCCQLSFCLFDPTLKNGVVSMGYSCFRF